MQEFIYLTENGYISKIVNLLSYRNHDRFLPFRVKKIKLNLTTRAFLEDMTIFYIALKSKKLADFSSCMKMCKKIKLMLFVKFKNKNWELIEMFFKKLVFTKKIDFT